MAEPNFQVAKDELVGNVSSTGANNTSPAFKKKISGRVLPL
jgi:hypothetical protein